MKKQNVIVFKSLLYILFLSFCICQDNFSSHLYKYYKFNDTKSINIFDLINEDAGVFKVEVLFLEDLKYERFKKTLNPFTCELEFVIDSNLSNSVEVKLCKNELSVDSYLLVNEGNPLITIEHSKFPLFEGVIVLVISGNFKGKNNKFNNDIKNDGVLREWHENGTLYLEFEMNNGIKDGICKKWYENGSLMMMYNYDNGKLDGIQKKWYRTGNLMAEWSYKNDKQHGLSKEWYLDGNVKNLKKFDNGKLINEIKYDEKGNKL